MQTKNFIITACLLITCLCTSAQKKNDSTAVADTTKNVVEAKAEPKKKKTEYEELISKNDTVMEGMLSVRHIEDKYYFEIPDSLLGRHLLFLTRLSRTAQEVKQFAGFQVNEKTLYFEKHDNKTLYLRAYMLSQFADPEDNIAKALRDNTIDPVIESFKIIQGNPDSTKYLIDVTSFFRSDNKLVGVSSNAAKSTGLNGVMPDRSFINTMKAYPTNVEVASTRTYGVSKSGVVLITNSGISSLPSEIGVATVGLNTSILLLSKEPMRRRLLDQRVGFFNSNFSVFSDNQNQVQKESMTARYRLIPKDVKAYKRGELTEPVNPIIYYVDPATPKKWVPYIIKGINDWNVAFEAAGFKNAIEGREWPADRPDISMEDARYSIIRYMPSTEENASGPHVKDPRSGEILGTNIYWHHNIMNLLTKWYFVQCSPLDKRAQKTKFDDELMGSLIRSAISHEVGHTLGLRHNFGASSQVPVAKLRDKEWIKQHGHTVSIMDYARFNYVAQPEDGIAAKDLLPKIGEYDKWAIKWGYQYRPEFKDEYEERKALKKETTEVLKRNPRLWFCNTAIVGEDPRGQAEDLGDNSMEASDYGVKNLMRVIENIEEWTKQDDDYTDLGIMYEQVLLQFERYVGHVQKNIAGVYHNNLPGKSPDEIPSAELRLQAVDWFARNVFEPPMWLFPKNLTEKTIYKPWSRISGMQTTVLNQCMLKPIIYNIYKQSYEKEGACTMDAYLDSLFRAVWKPVSGESARDFLCRELQKEYLKKMDALINDPNPTEVAIYIYKQLDRVEQFCSQHATDKDINGMHYSDLLNDIKIIRDKKTGINKADVQQANKATSISYMTK